MIQIFLYQKEYLAWIYFVGSPWFLFIKSKENSNYHKKSIILHIKNKKNNFLLITYPIYIYYSRFVVVLWQNFIYIIFIYIPDLYAQIFPSWCIFFRNLFGWKKTWNMFSENFSKRTNFGELIFAVEMVEKIDGGSNDA